MSNGVILRKKEVESEEYPCNSSEEANRTTRENLSPEVPKGEPTPTVTIGQLVLQPIKRLRQLEMWQHERVQTSTSLGYCSDMLATPNGDTSWELGQLAELGLLATM